MTAAETRRLVLEALHTLAPEAEPAALDPARPLREQVDLDSMDWLNLLDAVGERVGTVLAPGRVGPAATLDELVAAAAATRRAPARRAAAGRRTRTVRLADGRRVTLRPVSAGDATREAAFVRGLSEVSRYKRFMSTLAELPPAKLKYFTDVDQDRHIALAAHVTGDRRRAWVGVARCIADPQGGGCEFAVTVADDWQRSGLAGVLMAALMRAARAHGYRTIYGLVLAANPRMLALARQLGFGAKRDAEEPGVVRVERTL